MLKTEQNQMEKFMSYILRHKPEEIGLKLDNEGYVNIEDLIQKAQAVEHISKLGFNYQSIEYVVLHSAKQRFSFNIDKTKIRANQGHTAKVEIKYQHWTPSLKVFHGTAAHNKESILQNGLLKMQRHHVHLTLDKKIASENGRRFSGKYVLFEIDAPAMHRDGVELLISENNVVLVDKVEPKYIKQIDEN